MMFINSQIIISYTKKNMNNDTQITIIWEKATKYVYRQSTLTRLNAQFFFCHMETHTASDCACTVHTGAHTHTLIYPKSMSQNVCTKFWHFFDNDNKIKLDWKMRFLRKRTIFIHSKCESAFVCVCIINSSQWPVFFFCDR